MHINKATAQIYTKKKRESFYSLDCVVERVLRVKNIYRSVSMEYNFLFVELRR